MDNGGEQIGGPMLNAGSASGTGLTAFVSRRVGSQIEHGGSGISSQA
jgi:hypothetical protein